MIKKRKEIITLEKIQYYILLILVLAVCAVTLSKLTDGLLSAICIWTGIVLIMLIPVILFLLFFKYILIGFRRANRCDIEPFCKMDSQMFEYSMNSTNYVRIIKILKHYYREGGEIDKLVSNMRLDELYGRLEYLNGQADYFRNIFGYVSSIITSVIASLLMLYFYEEENDIVKFILVFIAALAFVGLFAIPYAFRGQGGSYRYLIDKYERKLLESKIEKVYDSINYEKNEIYYIIKQNEMLRQINNLKVKKRGRVRKEVEKDLIDLERIIFTGMDYEKYATDNAFEIMKEYDEKKLSGNLGFEYMCELARKYGIESILDSDSKV